MTSIKNHNRYAKGMAVLKKRFGKKKADKMVENLEKIYPFFSQVNVEFPFGDIYSRSVIDDKTREMMTIAALTVQGFSLPQLRLHILSGLKCGVTREEVLEIITQMIAYGGFPAATNALLTAKALFDDIDAGKEKI